MAFHIHYNSNKEKKLGLYGLFWQSHENCYWWKWILKIKVTITFPFQSSWTTLVMRWQQRSLSKSLTAHSEFLFCLIIKICCFIVFIFLFLSSASQSQKIQKTISSALFSNPISYTIGQNSLFVLLKFFQKVLWCQNIWYWYVIMML